MTTYDLGRVVGADGQQGEDGVGIASISKTGSSGLVDTYTITYTDSDTDTFTVTNGQNGTNGTNGVGISSISKTGTSGLVDTYTITLTNGNTATFTVTNGEKGDTGSTGATGNGISTIAKTGTSGLVDTYTITFTNGNSTTFTVTNGSDATVTIDSSLSSSSTNPVQNKVINTALGDKVNTSDIVDDLTTGGATKVLSAKQGTILDSTKLDKSQTSYKGKNVVVHSNTGLITFEDKPTIPTATSDLTNDSGFITSSAISGMLTSSDIVDNLTTNDSTKVLSAKQGKALKDLIGAAITYINQ